MSEQSDENSIGGAVGIGLLVGGFVPFTTVDFPDHLGAVVFCQGCAWRCRYCHNTHLQGVRSVGDEGGPELVPWENVRRALENRRGFLEAVVFSGGEPTAQPGLAAALTDMRGMGYLTGLHTAGMHPERLHAVLPLLDWVGLDIKAPFDERYDRVTGRPASWEPVRRSLELLLASGVNYELRTTVHPSLLGECDLRELRGTLEELGAKPTNIQPFRREGCADEGLL